MKNFNMILDCIQAFLSKDEINYILKHIKYKNSTRKFDVSNLLNNWITSPLDGWKSFIDSEVHSKSHFANNVDFTTFSKKAKVVPFEFFKREFVAILEKSNRKTRRSLSIPKQIVAVDSTTITFGESKLPWAKFHGKKSGIKLHVHLDINTSLPIKVEETNDRVHDNTVMRIIIIEKSRRMLRL